MTSIPHKVIICGIAKDIEARLPYSIKIVESIGGMFLDYRVLVYENNSTDKTKEILGNWSYDNEKVFVTCEDTENVYINDEPLKSSMTSYARNKVMDMLDWGVLKNTGYEYVIWIDLDFVMEPDYEGFVDTFSSKREWDAVFAYGIDAVHGYWDWLPFRDHVTPFGPELIGHYNWYVKKENLLLQKSDPWYPIYSAFGGCGIYRREAIAGCRYSAEVTSDMELVIRKFIKENPDHPAVLLYNEEIRNLKYLYHINKMEPGLKSYYGYKIEGFTLNDGEDAVVWRMSSFTYQYPVMCDHMGVNYSMIAHGYEKLFINPKLILRYGDPVT